MSRALASYRALCQCPRLIKGRELNKAVNVIQRCQYVTGSNHSSQDQSTSDQDSQRYDARQKARMYSVATGSATAFFGASYILYLQLKARADEGGANEEDEEKEEEEEEEKAGKKKEHISFHDRSVMAYEDRIRAYSTPDKIFRYFATLRVKDDGGKGTIYMTPKDFIRSITPGTMQPQEYGLDLYRTVSLEMVKEECLGNVEDPDSVFNRLGHSATPMKHFELAFKMFDLNGDGEVEFVEFETVQSVLRNATAMGTRHRDHVINGNVVSSVGGALAEHFFGPKQDQKLTIDQFHEFHTRLNTEILAMEFSRYGPVNGVISERDFAHMIVSHASLSKQKKKQMVQRAKKKYGNEPNPGISFDEVKLFEELLGCLSDIDTALGMFYSAGTSITPAELRQACKAVTGISIGEHLINVLFALFDENDDGELSRKEFIYVMKSRNARGLQKSRELGLAKLMNSVVACSAKSVKDQLGIES